MADERVPTEAEREDEDRRYRQLQVSVALAGATIAQDPSMTAEGALGVVLWARRRAGVLFPGKEETFDLIYRPRLIRIIEERFGLSAGGPDAPGEAA